MRVAVNAGRYISNHTISKATQLPSIGEFAAGLAGHMFDKADHGPHAHLHGIAPLHARPPENLTPIWRPSPRELLLVGNSPDSYTDEEGDLV